MTDERKQVRAGLVITNAPWASIADHKAYMRDFMAFGQAISRLNRDGTKSHVPCRLAHYVDGERHD